MPPYGNKPLKRKPNKPEPYPGAALKSLEGLNLNRTAWERTAPAARTIAPLRETYNLAVIAERLLQWASKIPNPTAQRLVVSLALSCLIAGLVIPNTTALAAGLGHTPNTAHNLGPGILHPLHPSVSHLPDGSHPDIMPTATPTNPQLKPTPTTADIVMPTPVPSSQDNLQELELSPEEPIIRVKPWQLKDIQIIPEESKARPGTPAIWTEYNPNIPEYDGPVSVHFKFPGTRNTKEGGNFYWEWQIPNLTQSQADAIKAALQLARDIKDPNVKIDIKRLNPLDVISAINGLAILKQHGDQSNPITFNIYQQLVRKVERTLLKTLPSFIKIQTPEQAKEWLDNQLNRNIHNEHAIEANTPSGLLYTYIAIAKSGEEPENYPIIASPTALRQLIDGPMQFLANYMLGGMPEMRRQVADQLIRSIVLQNMAGIEEYGDVHQLGLALDSWRYLLTGYVYLKYHIPLPSHLKQNIQNVYSKLNRTLSMPGSPGELSSQEQAQMLYLLSIRPFNPSFLQFMDEALNVNSIQLTDNSKQIKQIAESIQDLREQASPNKRSDMLEQLQQAGISPQEILLRNQRIVVPKIITGLTNGTIQVPKALHVYNPETQAWLLFYLFATNGDQNWLMPIETSVG